MAHGSLTAQISELAVPYIGATEETDFDHKVIYVRLQLLHTPWQWYVAEAELYRDDALFFGYASGLPGQAEWGYFNLWELREAGTLVYDCEFSPMPFSEVKQKYNL